MLSHSLRGQYFGHTCSTGFCARAPRLPGFESHIYGYLCVLGWASYLSFLCLSFLICKMGANRACLVSGGVELTPF